MSSNLPPTGAPFKAPSRRATREEEAHASGAARGGGARSEPKASDAHQARGRAGKQSGSSGSPPDVPLPDAILQREPEALLRTPRNRLLNVGYGNRVAAARVVAIVAPNASPMRRLRREAGERGKLLDATEGRRTRSILVLDSDHVVLSAIHPETLAVRLAGGGDDA